VDLCRRAREKIVAGNYEGWAQAWISRYAGS
jgi:hypothetical protein